MPYFPRRVPDSLVDIVDPIIEVLGPLVPHEHAERIRTALTGIDPLSVMTVGLELVLPPHEAACDIALLMPARSVPAFARRHEHSLGSLVQLAGEADSVWWELDTSVAESSVGAFIRDGAVDALAVIRAAATSVPGLDRAFDAITEVAAPYWPGPARLAGFFPDRRPQPAAAVLIPIMDRDSSAPLRDLAPQVAACASAEHPLIAHLKQYVDVESISVAADTEGRVAISWEGGFLERERAMMEGRWAPALAPVDAWGQASSCLASLLAVQSVHTFDSLLPLKLASGIDHIKVGPGGRAKAYVGAHIVNPAHH